MDSSSGRVHLNPEGLGFDLMAGRAAVVVRRDRSRMTRNMMVHISDTILCYMYAYVIVV